MTWKIPLFKVYWDEEDIKKVSDAMKTGMNWATGPQVQEFERLISEYVGTRYAVVFNSGTSALHSALIAQGIGPGDEVIVPSFTFISTANSVLFVGATPVFADIEEETFGLDPEDVEERITDKTKAIIPIHYGGCPCRIREIKKIAREYNLILIEDAAESFGATIDDNKVGTFGDSAMFSFCANKVISTGEGGTIVTDSKDIYDRLKLIRSHGRAEKGDYFSSSEETDYISLGYNFRLSNLLAALGISQLEKVEDIIRMRRKNANLMSEGLAKTPGLRVPSEPPSYRNIYQLYTITIEDERLRDGLMNHLTENGIMSKVYFKPAHLTPFYKGRSGFCGGELPVTEKLSKKVLTLPMYPSLTGDNINCIIDHVNKFISQ
jgi:perosamine synthetase